MGILNALKLKMEFGADTVFSDVTFEIEKNDKVGLIGVNGAGKTTLFKVITGEYEATDGSLTLGKDTVIGYMEQHACHNSQRSVYDEALTVFSSLMDMERENEILLRRIEKREGDLEELIKAQLTVQERLQAEGGLTYKSRVSAALIGLGFSQEDFNKPVYLLSGGQRSKLSLCKLLLCGANLLLLDEPTNHLDIKSVEWLENKLCEFEGSIIVISHDRYFLDRVTNKTVEIENGEAFMTKGSYTRYMELKAERQMNEERRYTETQKEIRRIEGIIATQKHFGQERNFVTIAHKQKSIDRLSEKLDEPDKAPESIHFRLKPQKKSGNDVLTAENISKAFGSKKLFSNVSFLIKKNERVFLLGDNGCGKTTLLKILTGEYKSDLGEYRYGANVSVGYFDQTLSEIDENKNVLDNVWDSFLQMKESEVRTALGSFLFKGDDVFKSARDLSGGEKARIALLKLMLRGDNLLLLDEPTNHLDIKSREALEKALLEYEGTMLIVSHDRYLINKLATRIFRIDSEGIKIYNGDYDYYVSRYTQVQQQTPVTEKNKVNEYKIRKEKESNIRKLRGAVSRCENEISENERKISALENSLNEPEIASSYIKIDEITHELQELHSWQDELMEKWEELQTELENAENEMTQ